VVESSGAFALVFAVIGARPFALLGRGRFTEKLGSSVLILVPPACPAQTGIDQIAATPVFSIRSAPLQVQRGIAPVAAFYFRFSLFQILAFSVFPKFLSAAFLG